MQFDMQNPEILINVQWFSIYALEMAIGDSMGLWIEEKINQLNLFIQLAHG